MLTQAPRYKGIRRSGGIAPFCLNLITKFRSEISFTLAGRGQSSFCMGRWLGPHIRKQNFTQSLNHKPRNSCVSIYRYFRVLATVFAKIKQKLAVALYKNKVERYIKIRLLTFISVLFETISFSSLLAE